MSYATIAPSVRSGIPTSSVSATTYPAVLPPRHDAFLYLDETEALRPIRAPGGEGGGPPRTFPSGEIAAALESGRSVVVDNTNPAPSDRESLVEIGRKFGAGIVGYFFESAVRECLARNARREGASRVPDVAVYATAKKLVPPSRAEGFDELFCVRPSGLAFDLRAC